MARTRRPLCWVTGLAFVVAAACGSGSGRGDEATLRREGTFDAAQCQAMRELAAARPPAGSLGPEEWRAAYDRYAEAADRAAAVISGDEARVLRELADIMRMVAEDPADPDLAARVETLGDPIYEVALEAEESCGVTFGPGGG